MVVETKRAKIPTQFFLNNRHILMKRSPQWLGKLEKLFKPEVPCTVCRILKITLCYEDSAAHSHFALYEIITVSRSIE